MSDRKDWNRVQDENPTEAVNGNPFNSRRTVRMDWVRKPVTFTITGFAMGKDASGKRDVPWIQVKDADGRPWNRPMNQFNIQVFANMFKHSSESIGRTVRMSGATGMMFGKERPHVRMEFVD